MAEYLWSSTLTEALFDRAAGQRAVLHIGHQGHISADAGRIGRIAARLRQEFLETVGL